MNDLQLVQQRLNQGNWRRIQVWMRRQDELPVEDLLAGYQLDAFGVPQPPNWLYGRHRYAVLLSLLALSPGLRETIRILDLKGLAIPCLPDCLASFSQLQALYLDANGLRSLPASLCQAGRLQVLSLGRNRIKRLPKDLSQLWPSLRKLYLGHNQINSLPFVEDDMLIVQGCIGQNPLPEPVGERWVFRHVVQQCHERIFELFCGTTSTSDEIMQTFVTQGLFLCKHLDDPMVYERMFAGMRIQRSGAIVWNQNFGRTAWSRCAALQLLPFLNRGSIVDQSLYLQHIRRLDLRSERILPTELVKLPRLQSVVVSSQVEIPAEWKEHDWQLTVVE